MELGTRSARLDRVARVMLLPRSPNDGIGAQRRLNRSCADPVSANCVSYAESGPQVP